MTEKERHRIMLDHDLVEAAERLGYSLSDAVEKGLRLLISAHGGHSQSTNGQSMQNREKLAEFKNEFKKSKETIEYLVKKDRMLTETVEQIPNVFDKTKDELKKEINDDLGKRIQKWVDFNKERDNINDFANRLRKTETELAELLNQLPINTKNDIQLLSYRMNAVEGRLRTLGGMQRR